MSPGDLAKTERIPTLNSRHLKRRSTKSVDQMPQCKHHKQISPRIPLRLRLRQLGKWGLYWTWQLRSGIWCAKQKDCTAVRQLSGWATVLVVQITTHHGQCLVPLHEPGGQNEYLSIALRNVLSIWAWQMLSIVIWKVNVNQWLAEQLMRDVAQQEVQRQETLIQDSLVVGGHWLTRVHGFALKWIATEHCRADSRLAGLK